MQEDKLQLMKEMVDKLNHAADAYYDGKAELMSDYEWDSLFDQLKKLEEETGTVLEDSPTMKVSSDHTVGQKEAHEFAALSLAKTKKPEEIAKWAEGKPIWLSWKLDGLTLVVTYDHGKLTKVVTRGDGHIGTNITHLATAITGILPNVSEKGHLVIRGEAVISYADFNQFVLESGEDYANPRNLASGSLTLKEIEEVKKRKIQWIPFTLVHTEKTIDTWGERMQYMQDLGFHVVERELIQTPTLANISSVIEQWTKKVTNAINPYPVDGLVVAYDDSIYAMGGSVTGHHATRAGLAFKWQDESVVSTLDHIEWSCAASTITPVAVFEPVELEGTIVKRASLCNISECKRLGIGDAGSKLEVIKANKIIPKVIRVQEASGQFVIPDSCPVCHSQTEVYMSDRGTETLKCTNPACPAKKLKKFARFVSKAGVDIDGISEATLARFIAEGWITKNGDIYRLGTHRQQIEQLDGFGEKSATNIINSIENSRQVEDQKLIYALNIPLIGKDVAKRLLSVYPFEELVERAKNTASLDEFSSIDGIGPEKSGAFVDWCKQIENIEQLEDLQTQISVIRTSTSASGNRCEGMTFVVTGDVHHYANRNELKAYIESQGGKVTGSVSKSTNYLINNDVTSSSSKNTKAKQLNIPIISEDEFIERFVHD
ncbi:MAG: NAD-dependent DNA ligase LigA [Erysipelotrichaceae bacterium]|nr:NAD-dependent DNA ligase LigA [Erysipelotrichaceae bacterium]MDY6034522.1 NAD-dependent DNA ligase LigA [Bulleidia sp.]